MLTGKCRYNYHNGVHTVAASTAFSLLLCLLWVHLFLFGFFWIGNGWSFVDQVRMVVLTAVQFLMSFNGFYQVLLSVQSHVSRLLLHTKEQNKNNNKQCETENLLKYKAQALKKVKNKKTKTKKTSFLFQLRPTTAANKYRIHCNHWGIKKIIAKSSDHGSSFKHSPWALDVIYKRVLYKIPFIPKVLGSFFVFYFFLFKVLKGNRIS